MVTLPFAHVVSASTFLEHFAHIGFGLVVTIGVFAFYARERRKLRRQLAISDARFAAVIGAPRARSERRVPHEAAVWSVAIGLAGAGLIHGGVASAHLGVGVLAGTFFVGSAVLQLCGAVAVLAVASRRLLHGAAVGSVAIVLLWLVTRTVGLPLGSEPWQSEPVGAVDLVASVLEVITAAGALLAARGRVPRRAGAAQPVLA